MSARDTGSYHGLSWKVERQHGMVTCFVEGELDMASADPLAETAQRLVEEERILVMDLEKLAFIDSTGIRLLARLHQSAEKSGRRFLLARISPPVRRVLHVAGLIEIFDYVEGAPSPEVLCPVCKEWVSQGSERCMYCGGALPG